MNHSRVALHEAWNACGRGALFSSRHTARFPARPAAYFYSTARPSSLPSWPSRSPLIRSSPIIRHLQTATPRSQEATSSLNPAKSTPAVAKDVQEAEPRQRIKDEEELEELAEANPEEFGKTEKAAQNAKMDLSARLSKDGQSKAGSFSEIWRLIKIARPEAKWLAVAVGLLITSSAITMSIPASVGRILDIATNPDANKQMLFGLDLTTFYLGLGGILTLGACANYGRVRILRIVGERIVTRQRSKLYSNTFIQNAEFFDANRVGDLISRLGSDTIIVGKSVTQNLSDGLRAFISGAAGLSLMAYTSLKLTSVLALLFPPVAIGAFFYGRAIRNLSRKIQQNLGTLTKIAEERLGNVRTAQAFAGEVQEVSRYNRQVRRIFNLGKREAVLSATFFGASGWAGNMTVLALLYIGGGLVQAGDISVGELTSFLMYTAYAGSSMFGLSSFYSELMRGVGAASRLFELQDRRPTIAPTVGLPVKSLQGPIKFEDVGFSYPTRPAVNIFRDLSFTIEEGMNVAIVAPSGAGKSTVASLLMRFYSPTSGRILVNGINIADMNAKQLRRKIGYVGQEPVLFSGTIAENISYGRPRATRSEILYAARRANCTFIGDFPDGLETHVGPRGTQLSGGQKQRIAIARALLKDPDILILDEATSALDAESETQVNAALASLLRGHNTTISIAHRMSTIKRSDRIICLGSDGRVAEVGTFAQLSARDGAFKRLMEHQLSGGDELGPPSVRRQDGDRHDQHHEDDHEESEGDKITQQMLAERKQRGG